MLAIVIVIVSVTVGRDLQAGRQPELISFGIIHFAGYLFFLLMPVEALVPFYQLEGHAGLVLILVAVVTAIGAQIIDYAIGRAVREETVRRVIGNRKYGKAQDLMGRYGSSAIFVFNLFPLSSPNVLLVAGLLRFGWQRTLGWSALGLMFKYGMIVYVVDLF